MIFLKLVMSCQSLSKIGCLATNKDIVLRNYLLLGKLRILKRKNIDIKIT